MQLTIANNYKKTPKNNKYNKTKKQQQQETIAIQKIAEATGDLIGNKNGNKNCLMIIQRVLLKLKKSQ